MILSTFWLLLATACLARFIDLSGVPNGWYIDEAIESLDAICVQQSGVDSELHPTPLFSPAGGGSFLPPTHLYGAAAWSALFGGSITSMRAYAAFFGILGVVGVFLLARELRPGPFARWAALAAALSPWAFQLSRIAWKTGAMPVFLVFGIGLLIRGLKRNELRCYITSALLLSMAMYQYPPARAQVPPLCMVIGFWWRKELHWQRVSAFIGTGIAICLPLIMLTLDGTISGRSGNISIFRGGIHLDLIGIFVRNVLLHLDPGYLFFRGDANLRHSLPGFGQLGLLDAVALGSAFIVWRLRADPNSLLRNEGRNILYLCAAGVLAAILPAALTTQGLPHSLRSCGAWPFVALASGYAITRFLELKPRLEPAILALAGVYAAVFALAFFGSYRQNSAPAFDALIRDQGLAAVRKEISWEDLARIDERAAPYYMVAYGKLSCQESAAIVKRAFSKPGQSVGETPNSSRDSR